MKKFTAFLLLALVAITSLTGCGTKEKVVIVSSSEEYRNEDIKANLQKKFPNYEIELQYMSTGTHGAKLKAEGDKTDIDIIIGLEVSYLKQNATTLADLSAIDSSAYLPELLPADSTYLPWERYSGCIVLREDLLKEKNLAVPQSYDDLLKPEYKGLITMPNPKASGTGYMFLLSLVNTWGEDKAFDYFDKLNENLLHFTSSGSGPVNELVGGEAAIGLGMTFQTVTEINKGAPLTIKYFEEGAPSNITGFTMVKGKEQKPAVKAVFDYIASDVTQTDKEKYAPEQVFKEQKNTIENYPTDIKYADMSVEDAVAKKDELMAKWKY